MEPYPRPKIPVEPILSLESFGRNQKPQLPSIVDVGRAKFVTSGRIAIAQALRHTGIKPGEKVLVPSYHCASMVAPVLWAKATPVFFCINPDTSVDLRDAEKQLDDDVKVMLVTHYFGFPQPMTEIRQFCDKHGLMLIEDCAHAFFGTYDQQPLGSFGDYAIASAMKFFPVYDGGCLVSNKHALDDIVLTSPGRTFQIKAFLNNLEHAYEYNRLRPLRYLTYLPMYLLNQIWKNIKALSQDSRENPIGPASSDGGFGLDPHWIDTSMSSISKVVIQSTSTGRLITKRREHYLALLDALSDLPNCYPLFANLPDGTVPYVFPLVVNDPEPVFDQLKRQGVPIIRFGETLCFSNETDQCGVSKSFSRRTLQFPCHQDLRPEELQWMIETIRKTFATN